MIFATPTTWVDRFRLLACVVFLILSFLSIGHAEDTMLKIVRDADNVGVMLGKSVSGAGVLCIGVDKKCVSVAIEDGLGVAELNSRRGDLIHFRGEGTLSNMVAVTAGLVPSNWQWLEKVALVITGGMLGFMSNTLFSIVQSHRDNKAQQTSKLRAWRDISIDLIEKRKFTREGDLIANRPEGLSRKNILRVAAIEEKLREIQSEMSVKPEQSVVLCKKADQLLMSLKA